MKTLIALLAALFIVFSYGLNNDQPQSSVNPPVLFQADEPGTGNDGEDTSERGFMCRLFQVFCSTN